MSLPIFIGAAGNCKVGRVLQLRRIVTNVSPGGDFEKAKLLRNPDRYVTTRQDRSSYSLFNLETYPSPRGFE
jgi:hypothetical protein